MLIFAKCIKSFHILDLLINQKHYEYETRDFRHIHRYGYKV
jgi:hypothetical protein